MKITIAFVKGVALGLAAVAIDAALSSCSVRFGADGSRTYRVDPSALSEALRAIPIYPDK